MIGRGTWIVIAALCLGGLALVYLFTHLEIELNPPPTPWTPTGAKSEYRVRIWIDPETKCQYYTTIAMGIAMTRRDGPDGLPICNRPVPEGVEVSDPSPVK